MTKTVNTYVFIAYKNIYIFYNRIMINKRISIQKKTKTCDKILPACQIQVQKIIYAIFFLKNYNYNSFRKCDVKQNLLRGNKINSTKII